MNRFITISTGYYRISKGNENRSLYVDSDAALQMYRIIEKHGKIQLDAFVNVTDTCLLDFFFEILDRDSEHKICSFDASVLENEPIIRHKKQYYIVFDLYDKKIRFDDESNYQLDD